jgi:ribonucleoside-diphosphate reductase alpha chain
LEGIGGSHSIGFGADRVRSLPDGVAQILQDYLDESADAVDEQPRTQHHSQQQRLPLRAIGDLCPDCGEATLISEEGCRKCHSCGYSEC